VVGYSSNTSAARATVDELAGLGVSATTARLDVAQEEMLRDMFERIRAEHGRLDVFVSNAARTSFRPAMELNTRNWQKINGHQRAGVPARIAAGGRADAGG
jgi:NAD(P)-dependent dehydrogenase (short-subunit alcohol dehydrogenase family)